MSTYTTSRGRRVVLFISGVAIGVNLLTGVASAESTHAAKGLSTAPGHAAQSAAADPGKGKSEAPGQLAKSNADAPAATGLSDAPGAVAHSDANPENLSPQPASNADFTGNGANVHGSYDSTRDGSASGNGNGVGEALGKPCAGCVGKADNKNPAGQAPDGTDHNAGYECDRNHGIGRSNPAHTGCTTTSTGGGSTGGSTGGGSTGGNVGGNNNTGNSGSNTSTGSSGNPAGSGSTGVESTNSNKPECGAGPMAVDVNGDGVVDSADCTAVLGSNATRAAQLLSTGSVHAVTLGSPAVLGESITRGAGALPRTGIDLSTSVALAMFLLATGFVLVRKAAVVSE